MEDVWRETVGRSGGRALSGPGLEDRERRRRIWKKQVRGEMEKRRGGEGRCW